MLKADNSALVNKVLKAVVGPYPGYIGTLAPRGNVFVRFFGDDTFQFALIAKRCARGFGVVAATSSDRSTESFVLPKSLV